MARKQKRKHNAFWDRWTEHTIHYRGYRITGVGKRWSVEYRKRGTEFHLGRFESEAAARKAVDADVKYEAKREVETRKAEARARAADARQQREMDARLKREARAQEQQRREDERKAAQQDKAAAKKLDDIARGMTGQSYKSLSPADKVTVRHLAARTNPNPRRGIPCRLQRMANGKVRVLVSAQAARGLR